MKNENVKISFIPQKPLAKGESKTSEQSKFDLFFVISVVILFLTIGVAIGEVVYVKVGEKEKNDLRLELVEYNNELNNDNILTQIDKLKKFEKKINDVKTLLKNHSVSSEVFTFLEKSTPKIIGFNSYNFSNTGDNNVQVKLKGKALNYEAIAYLSSIYDDENSLFSDFSFSDFALDEAGSVEFNFMGSVKTSALSYEPYLDKIKLEQEKIEKEKLEQEKQVEELLDNKDDE